MNQQPITISNKKIIVKGKVVYNDQRRKIDIKKPIRELIGNGLDDIGYVMELYLDENLQIQRLKELTAQGILTVILYFTK